MKKPWWLWWCISSGVVLAVIAHFIINASAKPNEIWAQMRAQAERLDDAQTQRVLNYVKDAGTVLCQPSWDWCQEWGMAHVSCCGKADAYESDVYRIDPETKQVIATITCNDPVINCAYVPNKVNRAPGTEFVVPAENILVDLDPKTGKPTNPVNDTGHGFIWIRGDGRVVCWSAPPGL